MFRALREFADRHQGLARSVLMVNLVLAFTEVGMIVMVQAAYASWSLLGNDTFDAIHKDWAGTVGAFIHPLSVATVVALGVLVILRPRQVPWWGLLPAAAIQTAIFLTTKYMWADWQNALGTIGRIREAGGGLVKEYEQIMSTHGIRVTLVIVYGLLLLAFALFGRTTRRADSTTPPTQSTPSTAGA